MSNFRRTIVVSDDLSAYRFRVRQRTLLEKLRYLQLEKMKPHWFRKRSAAK